MKKLMLIAAVTFAFAVTASAERKGDRHHDRHDKHGYHHGDDHHRSHGYHRDRRYNHHDHHSSSRVRIWVPGYTTRVWCPPEYRYVRQSCGRLVRVCISHGHYTTRYVPGYYRYSNSCNSGVSVTWRF